MLDSGKSYEGKQQNYVIEINWGRETGLLVTEKASGKAFLKR